MSDQAVEQSPGSIEERAVSALFGDPKPRPAPAPQPQYEAQPQGEAPAPEGDLEATAEPQAPEYEEIEFDGERFQVPPKLKKGLMLQKDYTQKTQSLAEREKTIEVTQQQFKLAQQQQAFAESVSSDVESIKMIDAYVKQQQNIDWNSLSVEDMMRKRVELDQLKDRRSELQAEVSRKETEFKGSLRTQHEELQKKSREILTRKIPGWNAEVEKDVKDWAISQGFTSEEVGAILNPVHAETLYKARQYDKLVASKSAAEQQASLAAPMGKPGSVRPMPQAVKDQLAFNRQLKSVQPNSHEGQQLIQQRLGGLFKKR